MVASCLGYYEIVKALAEAGTQTINRQNKVCSCILYQGSI